MTPAVQTIRSVSKRLTGRELDLAVDGGGQLGVEVDLRAALGEVLDHPVAGRQRHLGHDPAHRLDQVEAGVVEADLRVRLEQRGREGPQLGEDLDAGEAAADDDEGQQAVALGAGGQLRRLVEVAENAVADGDGLLDGLEADRLVGDPGDREGARHRARRDDDDVVLELVTARRPAGVIVAVFSAWLM